MNIWNVIWIYMVEMNYAIHVIFICCETYDRSVTKPFSMSVTFIFLVAIFYINLFQISLFKQNISQTF